MAASSDTVSMALFCDFENVALGVRDAQYDKFDIQPILQRLLTKGSIVVKKAYCDWDRYKSFKSVMHEANFEMIEIPHVRQSGKNSADIRMVVDALDLCYTKAHVDTFVIISGDSDFSPLVSKLRENAKQVIGVGVKQSTSDLLIANCDEFIFYDDLVREREAKRSAARRDAREPAPRRSPEDERRGKEELEARKTKGIDLAVTVLEDLLMTRSDSDRIWASVLKEAIKRRNPGFNESWYGYRTFGNLLEDAASRGHLLFGRDERSNAYVTRANTIKPLPPSAPTPPADDLLASSTPEPATQAPASETRRTGRQRNKRSTAATVSDTGAASLPAPEATAQTPSTSATALPPGAGEAVEPTPSIATETPPPSLTEPPAAPAGKKKSSPRSRKPATTSKASKASPAEAALAPASKPRTRRKPSAPATPTGNAE